MGIVENGPVPVVLDESSAKVNAYLKALNDGNLAFVSAFDERNAQHLDDAIKELEGAPHLDEQADALRDELKTLLARARDFISLPQQQQKTRASQLQQKKFHDDYRAWIQRRNEWVKSEGDRYGIELVNESNEGASQNGNRGQNR
jgi:hypothetical protein